MSLEAAAARLTPGTEDPLEVLDWATRCFAGRITLSTSLGPQSLVLLHMLGRLGREVPLTVLDTGLLFNETYALKDTVERRFGVSIDMVRPLGPIEHGLWERDPDACCAARKVQPLQKRLEGFDAWMTGIRRDQSPTRATASVVEWDHRFGLWKVNPLVAWTRAQVDAYVQQHDVPVNPLLKQGYGSVGCWPCTRRSDSERGGRWAGQAKTECGLHPDYFTQESSS